MNESTVTLIQSGIYVVAALSWVGLIVISRRLWVGFKNAGTK